MRSGTCPVWAPVVVVSLVVAAPASSQESRAAMIAAQQAEKAQHLHPYVPDRAEAIILNLEQRLLEQPGGVYPMFGSVYSGGGFTLGAGYRRFFGDRAQWNVHGLYSLSGYKLLQTDTLSAGHLRGRLDLGATLGWRDVTQAPWYGAGMGASPDDRANYRFEQTWVGGTATFRPRSPFVLDGALTFEDFSLKRGKGSFPSIEDVYTPETAPGLGASPAYVHTALAAGVDTRTSPGYSRSGGFYGVRWHDYVDTDGSHSFDRLDIDAIQHIPILRETWVLSLRGAVQTTLGHGDAAWFLLPSLGGGSTLRAYPSWRFRDRHSVLTSAEWRWIPSRLALDLAIFYDAGKVERRRGDLDLTGLAHDWGLGVRFHGPMATPLRVEIARGSEGWHLVFAGNAAF